MSKELEALNYLLEKQDQVEKTGCCGFNIKQEREYLTIIENALKALEIIKKYFKISREDDPSTITLKLKDYIPIEKYDLLKEILHE